MFSILSLYIAGPREQMNQVTSVLDSSHIYGSTMEEAEKLRETNSSELTKLSGDDYVVKNVPTVICS